MQKFLIPAALALAVAAGGTAFAETATGSKNYALYAETAAFTSSQAPARVEPAKGSIDYSLYEETAAFASQAAPAGSGVDYLRTAQRGEQRASTAPVPSQDWDNQAENARPDLEQPE